ncbi:hypothetical protein BGZ95_004219 [Linnemannia exigua]|uniref:F-box domain-containing protein n=1 Tax=Linnemannia exigua TaxID=604196 RepID=A0AAD4H938_9FUNG|nr:hypothetical protein BGZ95_004219 [Linnemannia exigua]
MNKALALPEILACIGSMLNDKDIISCMQVCKSWTVEFEPFLWRSFTLKQFDPTHKAGRPQLDQLLKNACYIRQLVIKHMDPAVQEFFMQCKQMEEVRFDAQKADEGDNMINIWKRFSEMIEDHGRLRKIVIDQTPWAMTDQVLETMERCQKLIVLETKDTEFNVARTQLYLRVCSKKLKRLSTWADDYYTPKFPEDLVFQEMRYLDICHATGMSMDLQLTWLSRCPNLISFRWESWTGQVNIDKLCDVLSGGSCPNLTALHLIVTLTDAEVAMVLDAAPRIEKLSLPRTGFGALSLIALRKHFSTLRDINLQFCSKVTSPMVQEILHTCANLQSISAEVLNHSDLIQQPWACRGLQMFDVGIDVVIDGDDSEAPMSKHKEVYERLAQLTELNYLSICSETQAEPYDRDPIKVSMEAGLAALETLKKLTFFSCKTLLDSSDPGEAFAVVEWMVGKWRRLETFEATRLISSMGAMGDEGSMVEPYATDILKDNGIRFTEYISDRGLDDEDGDFYEDGWTDYEEYESYDGYESDFTSYYDGYQYYEHYGPYSDDDDD